MSRSFPSAAPVAAADTDDTDDTAGSTTGHTERLSRLYATRFAFAIVWAGLIALSATTLTPVSVALLVLYPLFDVAAAVYDFRSSGATGPRGLLHLTMAVSLSTAIALTVGVSGGIPTVLRVWGAWAIAAGIVQLIVAARRRRLGGQLAMMLSGGISTVAGASFIVMAAGPGASLTSLAGYATLGGVFFLISAIRLHRRASRQQATQ